MSKPLPLSDFRAVRVILEPKDFADSPKIERPPSDLIEEAFWHDIMDLPDDVAIRTSNHNGSQIKTLYELSSAWIDAIGDEDDCLSETMIDTMDEVESITFNLLHGFYRQAIASLRNSLELVTIGAYCQLCMKSDEFFLWRKGQLEMSFGMSCDGLNTTKVMKDLNSYLLKTVHDSVCNQKNKELPGGWSRRLFSELSNYTHSRPTFTNSDLWQSNGPIYESRAYKLTVDLLFQTYAICYIMIKLARPTFVLPSVCQQLFRKGKATWRNTAHAAYGFLFLDRTK